MLHSHSIAVESHNRSLHVELFNQDSTDRKRVFRRLDAHARGKLGLESIGRHCVHAFVLFVVLASNRVHQNPQASFFGFGNQGLEDRRRTDSLVVVGDQDDVATGKGDLDRTLDRIATTSDETGSRTS